MIKLIDLLEEGIFDRFKKNETEQTPVQKNHKPIRPEYIVDDVPITVEGISDGYKVWKGNDPIGDIRQYVKYGQKGFDTIEEKGKTYIYYYNGDIVDQVGRKAYFSVSSPDPNAKQAIKKVAEEIETKALKNNTVNTYNI